VLAARWLATGGEVREEACQIAAWTNEESDRVKEIVHSMPDRLATHPKPTTFYVLPEYEQKLRRFTRHFERFGLTFLFSILIFSVALAIAAVMRLYALLGVVVVLMGASTWSCSHSQHRKRSNCSGSEARLCLCEQSALSRLSLASR
jgi:hypothetical protein